MAKNKKAKEVKEGKEEVKVEVKEVVEEVVEEVPVITTKRVIRSTDGSRVRR